MRGRVEGWVGEGCSGAGEMGRLVGGLKDGWGCAGEGWGSGVVVQERWGGL